MVIFFIAGIFLAVFISVKAVRESYRSKTIDLEVENLKKEAEHIQNENDAIEERIAYLKTPQFQEKIAKEKLNLQKPDENIVIVKRDVNQKPKIETLQPVAVKSEQEIQNYQKWWNFFFKY